MPDIYRKGIDATLQKAIQAIRVHFGDDHDTFEVISECLNLEAELLYYKMMYEELPFLAMVEMLCMKTVRELEKRGVIVF